MEVTLLQLQFKLKSKLKREPFQMNIEMNMNPFVLSMKNIHLKVEALSNAYFVFIKFVRRILERASNASLILATCNIVF